jgi:hypothetical protein
MFGGHNAGHSVLNALVSDIIIGLFDTLSPRAKYCALVCNPSLLPDFFRQS